MKAGLNDYLVYPDAIVRDQLLSHALEEL